MTDKTPEKKLLKRIFKHKDTNEPTTAQDIETIVIEQNHEAKQIKKLADDIHNNQHRAAVGTTDLISHVKHFKHTEKKRQKLTNQYIKQQRTDPTLSPFKIVQTVNNESDPLPPYTETPSAPPATLYPELQVYHTEVQTIDPFAPSNLCKTLVTLAIPDFYLEEPLSRNATALKNEITAQTKLLSFHQQLATPLPEKIAQILEKIHLLTQLQDKLPSFYLNENTLQTPYKNLTTITLSSASQSQHTSRTPTPSAPEHNNPLFTSEMTTHNTPQQEKPQKPIPFLKYYNTPLNLLINDLNELQISTHSPHIHWEFQLNKLQDDLILTYVRQPKVTSLSRTETFDKFTHLNKLLHNIQQQFHESTLEQSVTATNGTQNSYQFSHLFIPPEQETTEKQLSASTDQIATVNTILHQLHPKDDHTLIKHYQTKLIHLDNLQKSLTTRNPARSAGFSSPSHPEKQHHQTPPDIRHRHLNTPTFLRTPHTNPQPIFYPEVNHTRFIPKDLLNALDVGHEVQWAKLTQSTLEEFPHIDNKLKLKALTHQLTKHPAAKQAEAAQLLQAIQDPHHDPLNGFFTRLFQSFGLSRQEQNIKLRKAIEQQKFDWSNNPAIDLQNAISQVHISLTEISNNEIFRETLQDALKYKLQPYYHLVANTPITELPEKLRFIWKKIAVPTTTQKTDNSNNDIILNTTAQTQFTQTTGDCSKTTTETQPPTKDLRDSLMQEIKAIHKQIGRIHQLQTDQEQQRPSTTKKTETRTCFRCAKYGHIAKFCRSKPQQTQTNRFNQQRQQFNQQRPQFPQRQNQWRRPFQTRQNSNNFNSNRTFQANDNRQRRNNGNYNQQRNNDRNYDQQRYNRQSHNRFNPNQRNQNTSNPKLSRNSTFSKSQQQSTSASRDSTNQRYSPPAQHSENDFQPNLTV